MRFSTTAGDGAVDWNPVFEAISSNVNIPWLVVVDPLNGPGASGKPGNDDINYIDGTSKLNSYSNVKTIGYVRTNYGQAPLDELKANITTWSNWGTYASADVGVDGIFFDESSANFDYLNEAITFARNTFSKSITTICNFGSRAETEYYSICDVVIAFESCLNCADGPPYESQKTLSSNIPAGYESKAAVILNRLTGTSVDGKEANRGLISEYVETMKESGLGWYYFTSADYNTIDAEPATVGANVDALVA
ncbi:Spherulation-specific family 4-domain-containing protein [Fusarium solani]|uniref:Spherulation-specific family 4-domain-containing protein n=1 Tax=Fusarium solani TaxID=169388 RepID=A0A9P9GAZ0_FUSSL|nr:Spherulation-specific family 4-domain-containing protein [Fusarium solani]KAH7234412.1 Spherulation-specific family 4-domain-containing protein [Fusarium solani]